MSMPVYFELRTSYPSKMRAPVERPRSLQIAANRDVHSYRLECSYQPQTTTRLSDLTCLPMPMAYPNKIYKKILFLQEEKPI